MATSTADELCAWADTVLPGIEWRAGASDELLAEAEHTLGAALPAELRYLYSRHNGQAEGTHPGKSIFEGFSFLPLADALATWRDCLRIAAEVAQEYPEAAGSYRREWFPFAEDASGSHWCVDLETGAVLEVYEDFEVGGALGPSFDEFLRDYLASFERGDRIVDPTWGPMRKPEPRAPAPAAPPVSLRRKLIVYGGIALYFVLLALFVVWLELRR